MKTINPTIAKGEANYNNYHNICLPSPVHVDKGIGDECSVITLKRSNINPQKVRDQFDIAFHKCEMTIAATTKKKKVNPSRKNSTANAYDFLFIMYILIAKNDEQYVYKCRSRCGTRYVIHM
jgi:hypothetical protein